ncbi:MAG: hypothetical protein KJ737_11245 [Proteobacteria bacterium]|nr:hypothetical protein [Pseudomonadota bacterium]
MTSKDQSEKRSSIRFFALGMILSTMIAVTGAVAGLIQPSDLAYRGAFRLPDVSRGSDWTYSGYGMTFYPEGDPAGASDGYPGSIYAVGNDQDQMVAEISIPVPVISASKNLNDLNTATMLQPFTEYLTNDFLFEIPEEWANANTPGLRLVSGRYREGQWSGLGPS